MKIVILGAGYAGVFAAANLCIHVDIEILLIDKNPYHQLLQQIHHVTSGTKRPDEITFSIKELFQNDVSFMQSSVESIDLENKIVNTGNNMKVSYDYLIVALGSSSLYYRIQGAQEHSYPFRSVNDVIKLNEVINTLHAGSTIAICGGGATGISLAGALSDVVGSKFRIKVIEAHSNILLEWDRRIVEIATKSLLENNVEIIAGNPIMEITQSSITLQSGNKIASDLTIWTAGIKGFDIKITQQIEKTKSGRFFVDNYNRIKGFENVFAIGDISAFTLPNGQTAPQLAQFAVRHARSVAKNIVRNVKGEQMKELKYSSSGQILSLGRTNIGLLGGIPVTGFLCNYAEDFIIDNYIAALKNRGHGLPALVYDNNIASEISTPLNFLSYATTRTISGSKNVR
jgi:NADH dehydrogenase